MTTPEGHEGLIGKNNVVISADGYIIYSTNPSFEEGLCIYDLLKKKHREGVKKIMAMARIKPVTWHLEILYGGKYIPRTAKVFYAPDSNQFACFVTDRVKADAGVIKFDELVNPSQNYFVINYEGTVEWVKYPKKTVADAVGGNIFNVLLPKYKKPVMEVFDKAIKTGLEYPIEYGFRFGGEYRYKKGTVMVQDGKLFLSVHRIYHPEEEDL